MENIKRFEKITGEDVGFGDNLHPHDGEGRVGKHGLDKTLELHQVIRIAYEKVTPRPNIIVKGGKNAKWYLKRIDLSSITDKFETQHWRDTTRKTLWVIRWDDELH